RRCYLDRLQFELHARFFERSSGRPCQHRTQRRTIRRPDAPARRRILSLPLHHHAHAHIIRNAIIASDAQYVLAAKASVESTSTGHLTYISGPSIRQLPFERKFTIHATIGPGRKSAERARVSCRSSTNAR